MSARAHARRACILALAAGVVVTAASVAGAQAPAPCNNAPQITDAVADGHHDGTDVLAGWLSEAGGGLQAVIEVRSGIWVAQHSDATVNGAGYAMLFTVGASTTYVRATAAPDGTLAYDYGTYTGPSTFTTQGTATTGSVVYAFPGTVTIDIPAALGATPGTVLGSPYVLTYDGIVAGVPTPVDHAPGGVLPDDPARGADYVVGSCVAAGAGAPGTPGAPGGGPGNVTAVLLKAPKRLNGGGTATITGSVLPAQPGLDVTLSRRGASTAFSHVRTAANGTFTFKVPVREITEMRATAGGIASNTLTVDVATKLRVRVRRLRGGNVGIDGTYAPALPGKALLLGRFSAKPKATRSIKGGRFSFRFSRARAPRGSLQVVVVPSRGRAGRVTSNTVTLIKE
ncbi:MAG: hypothetical protein QOD69_3004 [Solirubrobacteraceae bacterium]|nr:hypothetical protein [Solirubrobacteraceae bacterium]